MAETEARLHALAKGARRLAGLGLGCPLQSVRTTAWPLYGNRVSLLVRLAEFVVV